MKRKHIEQIIVILVIILFSINLYQITHFIQNYQTLTQESEEIPFQEGVSFTRWSSYAYNKNSTLEDLQKIKLNNIDWIAVNNWWFQDYLNSTDIHMGDWSDSHENMTEFFTYAKSLGLHIMYKPMLNLEKVYEWRSYIEFSEEWMGNYTEWMVDCAKSAEEGGVEILSLGCEMGNMQIHTEEVREMIRQVREVYSGKLTYSANHDSFKFIDWWDDVDMIGVSMYSMMTVDWDPTVKEMTTVWNGKYRELEKLAMKWNKPILFTEIGIQALEGSNMIPNDNQISQEYELEEMENYYRSLFESKIWTASWFKGAYWWIWDGGYESTGFNPYLVKDLLQEEYGGVHESKSITQTTIQAVSIYIIMLMATIVTLWKINNERKNKSSLGSPRRGQDPQNHNTEENGFQGIGSNNTTNTMMGLVLGTFLFFISTDLISSLFHVFHQFFTYTIIFQISPVQMALTFMGLMLGGLGFNYLLKKYEKNANLEILILMIMGKTFLSLNSRDFIFFITFFLDFAIFFGLVLEVTHHLSKQKEENIKEERNLDENKQKEGSKMEETKNHIRENREQKMILFTIGAAIGVFAINFFVSLLVGNFTTGLGLWPLMICGWFKKKQEIQSRTQKLEQNRGQNGQSKEQIASKEQKPLRMMFLLNSFLAGMLIPFGNSILNLINFSKLLVVRHFLPAATSGAVLFVAFWIYFAKYKSNNKNRETKIKDIFQLGWVSNEKLLRINAVMIGIGVLYTLLHNFSPLWYIFSGIYQLFYMLTFLNSIYPTYSEDKTGKMFAYIALSGILFTLGFILNAMKGLLIYAVTFFVFKDGSLVRRDPTVDPVTNLDVPAFLNTSILLVAFILVSLAMIYMKIIKKKKLRSQ